MPLIPFIRRLIPLGFGCLLAAYADGGPTAEAYVAATNNTAYIVPSGELKINGYRMLCGLRPTVIDDNLDDYGAAYPGFIILNTRLLLHLAQPVMLWIYSHECGHQFRGPDEETADCFGVQRGRREGWLNQEGLDKICDFIAAAKGDNMHFAGPHRCVAMRACFADPVVH